MPGLQAAPTKSPSPSSRRRTIIALLFGLILAGVTYGQLISVETTWINRGILLVPVTIGYAFFHFLAPDSPLRSQVDRVIAIVASLWLITTTAYFLIQSRPTVDGVDLAYFVNNGRDILNKYEPSRPSSYAYFPGGYLYWATVGSFTGFSTPAVQATVVATIAINAVLVAALCRALGTGLLAAAFAGSLTVAWASRYECFEGTTELIATIPFLIGLIAWTLLAPTRRHAAAILFGAGLGLALFCKQQAGLLSLGVTGLLIPSLTTSFRGDQTSTRAAIASKLSAIATITIAAAATASIAFLSLGHGFEPIFGGLKMAASYDVKGTWLSHLYGIARNDESLTLVVTVVALATAQSVFSRPSHATEVLAVLLISAIATLIQFRSRGYAHYALYAVPCMAVAFATLLDQYANSRIATWRAIPRPLILSIALLPLAYTGDRSTVFAPLHLNNIAKISDNKIPWHHTSVLANSIKELQPLFKEHAPAFVIPPRRGVLYREFDLVSPVGYRFTGDEIPNESSLAQVDHIIVVDTRYADRSSLSWDHVDPDTWIQNLSSNTTFSVVTKTPAITVYSRRKPLSGRHVPN